MEAKGQINVYLCEQCGGKIVTRNRDTGTTPFILRCRATEGCDGEMHSLIYRVDQNQVAGWEWYAPKSAGERKKIDTPGMAEHVKLGGLMLRSLAN